MSLYQKAVLNKFLKQQDKDAVAKAYKKFSKHFHNPKIQENIRNSKEEQYQEGFLRELFVDVFGYTLNPQPKFNLTTELKNEKGAKKVDGAILKDGNAIGVIELKGTDTKDLEKVRQQAFDYKAHHSSCEYIVTSNFEKLRFYIKDAVNFEEFNLFTINEQRFEILYLSLAADNILNNIPLSIKEASVVEEESITKKFYADYSLFKRELFRDLVKKNMRNDVFRNVLVAEETAKADKNIKLNLFKKSQKLIDRFLFIFFAEDRGLLPPNSTYKILEDWNKLKDMDAIVPLYDRFKLYFNYLDTGRKGTNGKAEIFAYNGGLFKPDTTLDSLLLDDELLFKHTKKLSDYDFESQVDVNILGHIFENSLNEIESVNAEIEGTDFDKQKTKRKKDGVFYTPKYITKYIVDNTVGKLCDEKKAELGIIDEEFTAKRQKETKRLLLEKLDAYREWLLELTICDPACGSGAFLNQALDFLIKEHESVDELQAALLGGAIVFQEIENTILEKNIYGVDLNEESVEIAKLSLWLRTAQPRRKLNDLNNNIKCGNSLIESKAVAGDKAFKWEDEFPEVFKKGGFDVILGNPPYLRVQGLRENFEKESIFYETQFESATGRFDVYALFMEKSFQLINSGGIVSFILPHKFMVSDFGEGIRKFFIENQAVNSILLFGSEMVFADASTYTCIINLTRDNSEIKFKEIKPIEIFDLFEFEIANYSSLTSGNWSLKSEASQSVFNKLNMMPWTIKDVFENISQGLVSVGDDIFLIKGKIQGQKFVGYSDKMGKETILEADIVKPLLKGEDVKKYAPLSNSYYCLYPHYEEKGKTKPFAEEEFKQKYPLAYAYMLPFKDELIEKKIRYKTNPTAWYSLHRSREMSLFEQEKIITPEISLGTNMTLDKNNLYHNTKCYSLVKKASVNEDNKFWLAILNSTLMWYFLSSTGYVLRGGFFTFKTKYLEPFPLPKLNDIVDQNKFIKKVDLILEKTGLFESEVSKIQDYLITTYPGIILTKKLQNWYELEYGDFLNELNKVIKKSGLEKLTKEDEIEWSSTFKKYRDMTQSTNVEIASLNKEIDQMVYELYGLSEDEIKIVEGS